MTRRSHKESTQSAQTPTGPLTYIERYQFDVQGYLVRKHALDEATIDRLNRAIDAHCSEPPGPTIASQRFEGHLAWDPAFVALLDHPAVIDVLREMCGPVFRLDHTYGIRMGFGTSGLGLHGGGAPFDPCQYYLWRDGGMQNGLVAVQWALVDHALGDGGFCCVPGSHQAHVALPTHANGHVAVPAEMVRDVALEAGDVLFFTEALTHGTSVWQGRTERRSLLYKYSPGHATWADHYPNETVPLALQQTMTPRQQSLLLRPSVPRRREI